jgi:hypothetical protein
MSETKSSKVGYCRPPEHSRFKPGQSGNPRGRRPKQPVELDPAAEPSKSAVLNAGLRPVAVRRDGKVHHIPMVDAVVESLAQRGAAGSRLHAKLFLEEMRAREAEVRAERIKNHELWRKIVENNQAKLDAAKAAGLPPPEVFPHPLDVEFGAPWQEVEILGPLSAADLHSYKPELEVRQTMLVRAAYTMRYQEYDRTIGAHAHAIAAHGHAQQGKTLFPLSLFVALVFDKYLPPSLRWGRGALMQRLFEAVQRPEPELRADVLAGLNQHLLLSGSKPVKKVPSQPLLTLDEIDELVWSDERAEERARLRAALPRYLLDRLPPPIGTGRKV